MKISEQDVSFDQIIVYFKFDGEILFNYIFEFSLVTMYSLSSYVGPIQTISIWQTILFLETLKVKIISKNFKGENHSEVIPHYFAGFNGKQRAFDVIESRCAIRLSWIFEKLIRKLWNSIQFIYKISENLSCKSTLWILLCEPQNGASKNYFIFQAIGTEIAARLPSHFPMAISFWNYAPGTRTHAFRVIKYSVANDCHLVSNHKCIVACEILIDIFAHAPALTHTHTHSHQMMKSKLLFCIMYDGESRARARERSRDNVQICRIIIRNGLLTIKIFIRIHMENCIIYYGQLLYRFAVVVCVIVCGGRISNNKSSIGGGVDTKGYIRAFIIQSNLPLILNIITKMWANERPDEIAWMNAMVHHNQMTSMNVTLKYCLLPKTAAAAATATEIAI